MSDATPFIRYYQTELSYLRELADEFAGAFPEVAYLVSGRQADPAVERLLQGAALLLARVRQRIDDDFSEISHPLFDQLWPQYIQPIPSATMVQFYPARAPLRQLQRLPRGTPIQSKKVSGQGCAFTTCNDIHLLPIVLNEVSWHRRGPQTLELSLQFTFTGGASFKTVNLSPFHLQLGGERQTQYALYLWLATCLDYVEFRLPSGQPLSRIPARKLKLGISSATSPLTSERGLHNKVSLLRDYFVLPDRFLGLEMTTVANMATSDADLGDTFNLVFVFRNPPEQALKVTTDNFLLGCVPAINLSESERLDLNVAPGQSEFLIQLPHRGHVYSIDRVGAHSGSMGSWQEFQPLASATEQMNSAGPFYQMLRRGDGVEGGQVYVAICSRDGQPLSVNSRQLSVWCTHTDGDLVLNLGVGDLNVRAAGTPQSVDFTNYAPVKPTVAAAMSGGHYWDLLSALTMSGSLLLSAEGLRFLVAQAQPEKNDLPRKMIERVAVTHETGISRRMLHPVTDIHLMLNEAAFLNLGDLHLFASIIFELCAQRVSGESACALTVVALPSKTTFHFASQVADQPA